MKIKLLNVGLYGYKVGEIIHLGKHPNQKWRRVLKDNKIDGNIEIIKETKAKKSIKKIGDK